MPCLSTSSAPARAGMDVEETEIAFVQYMDVTSSLQEGQQT